jgi:F-type H+-transporting ATPase subunit delta
MNESQISVRYAKALFQSASQKQILEKVYHDMELLSDTCKLEDFQYMLAVPVLKPSQKCALVDSIFKTYFSEVSLAMINLVIKNRREAFLPGIARNFRELYRKATGIHSALLVTSQPVDEQALKNVKALIAKAYDTEVELTASVNENMIGGFILTIENKQYDASVATSLRKLKKELLETSIVNK